LESGAAKKQTELNKIVSELSHLADAKCPYCLQKFEDAQAKIDELTAKKATLEQEIVEDKAKVLALKEEETAFNEAVTTAAAQIEADMQTKQREIAEMLSAISEMKGALTYSTAKELAAAKSNIVTLQDRLVKLSAETNPHLEAITTLEAEGEVKVGYDRLEELLKLQEHQQFLVKLLMDKNSFIRKNIISKTIPFLNKRIGYYTEKLNLPHLAMFQPDMSCEISQYGRTLDHGNLSNGEKKRLNLSLCLAFRDVLTYLHSRVNVLFTDEIDGGSLDSNCIDSLITLLKHKAWDDDLGIYIISHRPEFDGRCDRNLIVRKERGFSNLITQPDE
jgi:DNA repair exonuclease SbcCD ATPase subunit